MRFRYDEVSPAGKRQYFIALGRADIDLLLGEATNALRHTPDVEGLGEVRQHLKGIVKGLAEAQRVAKRYGDDGERLPWIERRPAPKREYPDL